MRCDGVVSLSAMGASGGQMKGLSRGPARGLGCLGFRLQAAERLLPVKQPQRRRREVQTGARC
jgi:hypothetical protein